MEPNSPRLLRVPAPPQPVTEGFWARVDWSKVKNLTQIKQILEASNLMINLDRDKRLERFSLDRLLEITATDTRGRPSAK